MGKKIDLTGQRFGRLIVLREGNGKRSSAGIRKVTWIARCDCGNIIETTSVNLLAGDTKSCGCLKSDIVKERNKSLRGRNKYDLESYSYAVGWTGNGTMWKFDKADFDLIKDYRWNISTDWHYIMAHLPDNHDKSVYFHRLIMGVQNEDYKLIQVDHIDGDTLNCCRSNLRIVSAADNAKNKRRYKNNKSGVTGVYWSKDKRKWISCICDRPRHYLFSSFDDYEEAVMQRKEWESLYYKDFSYAKSQEIATLNKISE